MQSRPRFHPRGLPNVLAILAALTAMGGSRAEICCDIMDGTRDLNRLRERVGSQDTGRFEGQEAILDFVVDSTWSRPGSFRLAAALRVLAKHPVDTAVFTDIRNARGPDPDWLDSVSRDTSGFPGTLVDSTSGVAFHAGDTLRNVFALRATVAGSTRFLALRGIQCKFLSGGPGPFPIADALASLGAYLDTAGAAAGPRVGSGKVKLGIVFAFGAGDPGILVTAEADSTGWIVRYQVGSGDCPAGCTDHSETRYHIDRAGTVTVISRKNHFLLCPPIALYPQGPVERVGKGMRAGTDLYTPQGRKAPREKARRAPIPLFESR